MVQQQTKTDGQTAISLWDAGAHEERKETGELASVDYSETGANELDIISLPSAFHS
jgi:hypothetical protein